MKSTLPALCVVPALLCGCVAPASEWNKSFGDAARQLRAAQVIDVDAPRRNTTPPVIDGKATSGAQTGYATSYGYAVKEARQAPLTVLPVGQ
jgi:hypothetical protein